VGLSKTLVSLTPRVMVYHHTTQ